MSTNAAPFVPPSDPRAILTTAEVAAWLRVNPREVQRMGVPRTLKRRKTIRYRVGEVLAWLDREAKKGC